MNRTIKFRAKKTDDRSWAYGSLIVCDNYCIIDNGNEAYAEQEYRFREDTHFFRIAGAMCDKTTICQFTGLYAKSGKEIYEGDILKIIEGFVICICVVTWNEEIGAWSLKLRGHTETGERPLGKWLCDNDYDIKVVGNIFDNKEILEYE